MLLMFALVNSLDTQSPFTTVNPARTKDERSTERIVSNEPIDDTRLELMLINMEWLNECDNGKVVVKRQIKQ